MLVSLHIKNYILVDSLDLEFGSGLTIFTGETGAGKSIMIDALMLALGARADISVIRPKANQCELVAVFSIEKNSQIGDWLFENDFLVTPDTAQVTELMLKRVINAEGRSKCYINDHVVTLQTLKTCGEFLVHIHGQHEFQSLLKPNTHLDQLDKFAGHNELLQVVKNSYHDLIRCQDQLNALYAVENPTEKLYFIKHQLAEFEDLVLEKYEEYATEHKILLHAQDYLKVINEINNLVSDNEEYNILSNMYQALNTLHHLPQDNSSIANTINLFNQAVINIEEGLQDLMGFAQTINQDPERLLTLEQNITKFHNLARKHRVEIRDLSLVQTQLLQEQEKLLSHADKISDLETEYEKLKKAYHKTAADLSASRRFSAPKLELAITELMQTLGMPGGFLEIKFFANEKPCAKGIDQVEYYICTNLGMPTSPLQKIASGGELSRISLAIEVITAQQSKTPTLLFDEVDVGIGGTTAAIVGNLLRELSQRLQIFSVTHQPQIAGFANAHYQVNKVVNAGFTETKMHCLDKQGRIDELARMLGGLSINEQTKDHARQLIID